MSLLRPRPDPARLAACRAALEGLDLETGAAAVRQKSRDFYWYSPILKAQLADVAGDFVVSPRSEAEVIRVLAACHAEGVPVTVRGAGTGNYGQAMPLAGGCILHMRHMNRLLRIGSTPEGHSLVAEPGAVLADLEAAARAERLELRLFPSTTDTATIGGFVAGGSSGIGAIRWGGLRTPGNIRRLRLVTMEAAPRVLELTGADVARAAHAYGVTGVITEVEVPVDPAQEWVDVLLGAPDFTAATALGIALGEDGCVTARMISTFAAPIPERYFMRHGAFLRPGEAAVAMIVAADAIPALEAHLAGGPGAIRFRGDRDGAGKRLPEVFSLAWNHTTLRALKVDPETTYLQMMFRPGRWREDVAALEERFGGELLLHAELTRFDGRVTPVALPLLRTFDPERVERILAEIEGDLGLTVFNPHRVTLEEGGMKRTDPVQLAFKHETDPKGLLNPGKMIAWERPDWVPVPGKTYLFVE